MAMAAQRRRASPRAQLTLDVSLTRPSPATDVTGRTIDLGPGGMRVATRRPLHVGEQLAFVLALDDGTRLTGRAHVMRHHGGDAYGLCFDDLAEHVRARLAALAPGPTDVA